MFLVGDIGGTSTRLALAEPGEGGFRLSRFTTDESARWPAFEPLLRRRREECKTPLRGAAFAIAGPIVGRHVRTTNLPWVVDADALEKVVGAPVLLLNDLEAAAHGVLALPEGGATTLQAGVPGPGAQAVIAAGTGLGEALLVRAGNDFIPCASEGGHTDFGPRNDEEVELWRFCRARFGHVSYERLVSGPGLAVLYEFQRARLGARGEPCWRTGEDEAAAVTRAAREGSDPAAVAALRRFCAIFGAEAGNLALKTLATGGVHVAGGIALKILDALRQGEFLEAFRDKGRYREMMQRIPVQVILDEHLGLRGAARAARLAWP